MIDNNNNLEEKLIHLNTNYQVVLIPYQHRKEIFNDLGTKLEGNYEVRHRVHDVTEFISADIYSALSVAEQYNKILDQKLWVELDEDQEMLIEFEPENNNNNGGGGMVN